MNKQDYISLINAQGQTFKVSDLIQNFPTDCIDSDAAMIANFVACKQAINELGCERIGDLSATIGLSDTRPWINSFAAAEYSKL